MCLKISVQTKLRCIRQLAERVLSKTREGEYAAERGFVKPIEIIGVSNLAVKGVYGIMHVFYNLSVCYCIPQ